MTYDQTIELTDEIYELKKKQGDSLSLWHEVWSHLTEAYGLPKYPSEDV